MREVLRAWLAGQGKRPAARRAQVNAKTAQRYIAAAQEAGLSRDGGEEQLTDELLGMVAAAVRPARPAGHGESWQLPEQRKEDIARWVGAGLTLVKTGELLERSGTVVPYRTLARFAAEECGYSPRGPKVTVPADDGEPGQEVQVGLDPGMRLDSWDTTAAVRCGQQLRNELATLRFADAGHGALIMGPPVIHGFSA